MMKAVTLIWIKVVDRVECLEEEEEEEEKERRWRRRQKRERGKKKAVQR